MILTGPEIARRVEAGQIKIDPYDPANVNPNSYNLTLGPLLKVYEANVKALGSWWIKDPYLLVPEEGLPELVADRCLDSAKDNPTRSVEIPARGIVLVPNVVYLAATVEVTEAEPDLVPWVDGRSSVGRLGWGVHVTAGVGDCGFNGSWTLEMTVVTPLVVYPHTQVGQLLFETTVGETRPYAGKYVGQREPQPSRLWKELLHVRATPAPA